MSGNDIRAKPPIRVGIVGVGNCCSSLIQGICFYSSTKRQVGLTFPLIDGRGPQDIRIASCFDVDRRKVGLPISQAIHADPNCALTLIPKTQIDPDPVVSMGVVADGVAADMSGDGGFILSNDPPVDIAEILLESGTEILVSYLPVGSILASRVYAEAALQAGCSFINCVPVKLARDADICSRFAMKNAHLFGDDIKSQVGATVLHQRLVELFSDRGAVVEKSFQLNVGGNTDFKNMLDRSRLVDKRESKTGAILRRAGDELSSSEVRIGPSDYVAYLKDEKRAFIEILGSGFANAPISLKVELAVQDSPNSAACVIDLIRFASAIQVDDVPGRNAIETFYMKSPREDVGDYLALRTLQNIATR